MADSKKPSLTGTVVDGWTLSSWERQAHGRWMRWWTRGPVRMAASTADAHGFKVALPEQRGAWTTAAKVDDAKRTADSRLRALIEEAASPAPPSTAPDSTPPEAA
jgi:hypothetical protein